MVGMERFSWPGFARMGGKLLGGRLCWQKWVRIMNEFVNDQDEALKVPILTIMQKRDPFFQFKRSMKRRLYGFKSWKEGSSLCKRRGGGPSPKT